MAKIDSYIETREAILKNEISKGIKHLKKVCPIMKSLIAQSPKPELLIQQDHFYYFCRAITYQQLSGKAASTIFSRFEKLARKITPKNILKLEIEDMRAVGLSYSKAAYIQNVASFWLENPKLVKGLSDMTDEEVLKQLTSIKGVGVWTVQMFLMFADGRLDVFPTGDLAIRKALVNEYGLSEKAKKEEYQEVSQPWSPYKTIASWYLWRSLEL